MKEVKYVVYFSLLFLSARVAIASYFNTISNETTTPFLALGIVAVFAVFTGMIEIAHALNKISDALNKKSP